MKKVTRKTTIEEFENEKLVKRTIEETVEETDSPTYFGEPFKVKESPNPFPKTPNHWYSNKTTPNDTVLLKTLSTDAVLKTN